jgi:hypothetical protein
LAANARIERVDLQARLLVSTGRDVWPFLALDHTPTLGVELHRSAAL